MEREVEMLVAEVVVKVVNSVTLVPYGLAVWHFEVGVN